MRDLCRRIRGRHARSPYYVELSYYIEDNRIDTERDFNKKNEYELLHKAINKLPKQMKECIYYAYFEDMPYYEIAEKFYCSPQYVCMLISKAKTEIRRILTEELNYE